MSIVVCATRVLKYLQVNGFLCLISCWVIYIEVNGYLVRTAVWKGVFILWRRASKGTFRIHSKVDSTPRTPSLG